MQNNAPIRHIPENLGILAMEVYFPNTYVQQEALETFNGVSPGKYTLGLGQHGLSFCGDREDPVSMAMSALSRLLTRHSILPAAIGRLEVATESSIDASKSIKTYLMQVLNQHDPSATDIDGGDCVQACHGGAVAVGNALNWLESSEWNGRLAIVVMTDVAVYEPGPARPTSGAGAIALLLGPDAPLAFERGLSASHTIHAFDFYKPVGGGLYPHLDGALSVKTYLQCLEACYACYAAKFYALTGERLSMASHVDYCVLHHPYNKLVQKAFRRLVTLDYDHNTKSSSTNASLGVSSNVMNNNNNHNTWTKVDNNSNAGPLDIGNTPTKMTTTPEPVDLEALQAELYNTKVLPCTALSQQCGNSYTASLWWGLAQLVESKGAALEGQRIVLFAYGSGAASKIMSVQGRHLEDNESQYTLTKLQAMSDIRVRLASRIACTPEYYTSIMKLTEERYGTAGYCPEEPALEDIPCGAYYLTQVDDQFRRWYMQK